MWRKITGAVIRHGNDEQEGTSSQGEVLGKVLEQHPNLSMFQSAAPESPFPNASPPSSPSKHGRRSLFKRASKAPPRHDDESIRAPSPAPSKLSVGIPKKVQSSLSIAGNHSQLSLGRASGKSTLMSAESGRKPSIDALRSPISPVDSVRSPSDLRRPSLDMLRSPGENDMFPPITPNSASHFAPASVRSILREPNTPGTGRNVRFFSRDAYKTLGGDESTEADYQTWSSPAPVPKDDPDFQKIANLSAVVTRSPPNKNARPSAAEMFSRMQQEPELKLDSAAQSESGPIVKPNQPLEATNLLDMSLDLQLPNIPPGLGFDIDLDSAIELPVSDEDNVKEPMGGVMTSTPYRDSRKGKGKEVEAALPVPQVDETIFHSQEKSPRLPTALHDRSNSFSFGQTVFFSINEASKRSSTSSAVPSLTSSDTRSTPLSEKSISSHSSIRNRSRALSDTVFHSMLRSSPSKPPEADINDESSSELVVYSPAKPEPDPFSATANTYYTPQTMIPVTPPRGAPTHVRKTSKEDSLIVSLQTQLALQTELCNQYETDLRARDELCQVLGNKLADLEKEDVKRRGIVRAWKKKVIELERTCRFLEDEVEGSRQESMERSIMDEASGEALRMLHRQIASLEREKGEMSKREEGLREEVETLEALVKERSEDVLNLKESLWTRDESQRELQKGIQEAQEQIEMLGNVSIGMIDEEEVRRHMAESEQRSEEERARHRTVEAEWEQQRAELVMTAENAKAERIALEGELETLKQQTKSHEDEFTTLKAELEAQWGHSEKASERIETLTAEKLALEKERDQLNDEVQRLRERMADVEKEKGEQEQERDQLRSELDQALERINNIEMEWNENESRRAELEQELEAQEEDKKELQEVNEDLQQQVQAAKDQVRYKHEHAERLASTLMERESRLTELEMERQFTVDNVSRLENNIQQRDNEITEYSNRVVEQEKEIEKLRERVSNMNRDHARALSEQQRALQEASGQQGEARQQLEELLKLQGEQNVELKTNKEKITGLKDEVERLRRQVHHLQQESADKEVRIVQLSKQHENDKEDLAGINIALDSKQQELELLKRRLGVRGTAGSTATPASVKPGAQRREFAMFSTPSNSRPSSVISDSGKLPESTTVTKERKLSSETPLKGVTSALSKSTRVNGSTSTMGPPSTIKPRVNGTMGPPPRASIGTPTPAGRISSITRSTSSKPVSSSNSTSSSASSTASHRRSSSVILDKSQVKGARASLAGSSLGKLPSVPSASPAPSSVSEQDEKENVDLETKTPVRRSMIPTPA